jgi:hypothetical protein
MVGYEIATSPMVAIGIGAIFTALIIAFNIFIINGKIREISSKR